MNALESWQNIKLLPQAQNETLQFWQSWTTFRWFIFAKNRNKLSRRQLWM